MRGWRSGRIGRRKGSGPQHDSITVAVLAWRVRLAAVVIAAEFVMDGTSTALVFVAAFALMAGVMFGGSILGRLEVWARSGRQWRRR